jgi:peptidoglycan/LPS O-acetylase OafA/YrhL
LEQNDDRGKTLRTNQHDTELSAAGAENAGGRHLSMPIGGMTAGFGTTGHHRYADVFSRLQKQFSLRGAAGKSPLPAVKASHLDLPKYRSDIDGLRAVAVGAVIAFHAFPDSVRGGFVGVDIFFVISGFLISTLIFENFEHNSFSFREFYARRIKRIFPALILVITACLAFGWFALLTDEYRQLGKHSAAAAAFVANFAFWQESGYFDNAAVTKPLLHLWSLGIEEQFYLVWPGLLYLVLKARLKIISICIAVAVISFGVNIGYYYDHNSVADFYSPVSRIWELIVGALLAYASLYRQNPRDANATLCRRAWTKQPRNFRDAQSIAGLAIIVASFYLITDTKFFPGWWAALPVLGTCLLLSAGPYAIVNSALLSSRLAVWIGLISYPLYLWHWPLLSLARIINQSMPSLTVRITAIIASFILAATTYLLLEKPIRFGKFGGAKALILSLLMFLTGSTGYAVYKEGGIASRAVVNLNPLFNTGNEGDASGLWIRGCGFKDTTTFNTCRIDKSGQANYALFGDSKAASLCPGLIRESVGRMKWLCIGGAGADSTAVPVLSDNPIYTGSGADPKRLGPLAADSLVNNPDIKLIVITTASRVLFHLLSDSSIEDLPESKYGDVAFDGLDRMVEKLAGAGKKVVITIDNPTLLAPKDCMARITAVPLVNRLFNLKNRSLCSISYDRQILLSKNYRDMLARLQEKHRDSLRIFDPTEQLCDMRARICSSSMNGRMLYEHSDHISDYAATLVAKKLIPFIQQFATER